VSYDYSVKKAKRLGLSVMLCGALIHPPTHAIASEKFNWKIKKEETRRSTAGYSDSMSYIVGASIKFKISCPATDFYLEAIRVGYYEEGQGKRIFTSKKTRCLDQSKRDSRYWKANLEISTSSFPHGMYLFVIRDSDKYSSYIPIILREKVAKAKAVFSVPTMTMQAYNSWTGADTYGGPDGFESRLRVVDFRKPFDEGNGAGKYLRYVHPLIVYIEELGLDVSYVADTDLHFDKKILSNKQVLITAGHDEYWTMQERETVIQARKRGLNTVFFGANAGYWNTRLLRSNPDSHVVMEIYKSAEEDPNKENPTIKFRDLGKPEPELTGLEYKCFPARGNLELKQPQSFVFQGVTDFENLDLEGLVGPEVDSLLSNSSTLGTVINLAEARVRCGTKWYAPRFGQMNMILVTSDGSAGGNFSTGTMGWVTKGLSASEKSDIGGFTRVVSKNVLEKALQGPLRK
jgi:hypothetical protein